MKLFALLVGAAAIGVVAAASAGATDRMQLAQAQGAGAQSQPGASGNQQTGTANRQSGAAKGRGSESSGAAASTSGGTRAGVRSEGGSVSRSTIHQGSAGTAVRGNRSAVGVRTVHSDDRVVTKRNKARRYVYSEPSTTVIRKKKRYTYREPSSAVIVHKRRPSVAVDSGVSTRSSVRTQQGGTAVRSSGSTRETVGGGGNVRGRSSSQGGTGASSSPQGSSGTSQGGQTTGRSGTSGSSGGQTPANR